MYPAKLLEIADQLLFILGVSNESLVHPACA